MDTIRNGMRLCDEKQQEKCSNEFGDNLEWTCSRRKCGKIRGTEFCDYTLQIFHLRLLRLSGYPFRANDLTMQQWEDLGSLEEAIGK